MLNGKTQLRFEDFNNLIFRNNSGMFLFHVVHLSFLLCSVKYSTISIREQRPTIVLRRSSLKLAFAMLNAYGWDLLTII